MVLGAGRVVGLCFMVVLLCDGVDAWHASFGQASAPTEKTTSGMVPFDIPRPRVDGEHGDLAIDRCGVAEASVRKALAVCDPGMSCDTTQKCDTNCLHSWQSALRDARTVLARTTSLGANRCPVLKSLVAALSPLAAQSVSAGEIFVDADWNILMSNCTGGCGAACGV